MTAATQRRLILHSASKPIPVPPPVPVGPVLAIDGSNWTQYDYTDEVLSKWRAAGVGLVIEQAVDPPAGYPPGRTRQHIAACINFGMPVATYVFWWAAASTDFLKRQLDLLDGFESHLVRAWIDVEDSTIGRLGFAAGASLSQLLPIEHLRRLTNQPRPQRDPDALTLIASSLNGLQADIASWLEVLDSLPVQQRTAGVYSGPWYQAYVDLSPFISRPLWTAEYDGIADVNQVVLWGGAKPPATIKQFAGTSSLAGWGGIDLDVVGPAESALL